MGRETLEPQELLEEEDLERSRERSLRTRVAVTAATLAVLASLSALQAERTAAESILSKNEAVLAQSRASDEWAYRQASRSSSTSRSWPPGAPRTSSGSGRTSPPARSARARPSTSAT